MKQLGHSDSCTINPMTLPIASTLTTPWEFICPSAELHSATRDTAKIFLDSLALSVSNSQSDRQNITRKRKRAEDDQDTSLVLRLKQLYVDGFTSDQIWEQATRIFNSARYEIERDFSLVTKSHIQHHSDSQYSSTHPYIESSDSLSDAGTFSEQSNIGDELSDSEEFVETEDITQVESLSEEEEERLFDENSAVEQSDDEENKTGTYTADRFGLNDGFFSIDDFNKQTENFERQDNQGRPDEESDEDEIDWHSNPLATRILQVSSKDTPLSGEQESLEDSDEEDGPTFDNIGSKDGLGSDDEDGTAAYASGLEGSNWINTSDIMYADFFAPPPRKASTKRLRPLPKTQPHDTISNHDIDRAMADVRRDLFEDEVSTDGGDNGVDDSHNSEIQRSSHEKQRARIADEIRRLEAANVAKKEWMLSGEARAIERPVNSLIEEDLDFERIGKPVPVVTTELSENIEQLIKRRIIAKEFDEVMRRRPGFPDRQGTQKSRIELDDSKPQQSLADLYENDHLRATDPKYVDPQNQKLTKEHADVSALWREISSQLDTLSNWHYKPKAPQASISVITDVATISMEDAQPTTAGAVRGSATLAPQEIYAPGDESRAAGELVSRSGMPVTKEEMSREDKAKLRRRQKKQNKAATSNPKQHSGKPSEKQQIVSDLKKAGVKVIGKEGEVTDIHGKKIVGVSAKAGAQTIKL